MSDKGNRLLELIDDALHFNDRQIVAMYALRTALLELLTITEEEQKCGS